MFEEGHTFWEKLKSLTLSIKVHPFDWHFDAGCNHVSTFVAIGPIGILVSYWG